MVFTVKKLDQAVGSPLANDDTNGATVHISKTSESLESLLTAHNELNATVISFKTQLEQAISKLQEVQKQITAAAAKPDGVTEVRDGLAKLGSRVEDLSATIETVKGNIKTLNKAQQTSTNANQAGSVEAKSTDNASQ